MDQFREFTREQLNRLALRVWLVVHGIAAAVFWTLFFVCWTLLVNVGMAWIGWVFLTLYVVVISPFWVTQALMIIDLLASVFLGHTFVFGKLQRGMKEFASAHPERLKRVPIPMQVLFFFADASPLSSVALWSFVVLARMPKGVHVPSRVRELKRQEMALDRMVFANTMSRLGLAAA